jgi:hypothetical protein
MNEQLQQLLKDMKLRPGVSRAQLDEAQKFLGKLPEEYAAFLAEADGGEGKVGSRPLVLWSLNQLAQEHEEQEVTRSSPGLVLIGSDGGAEAYGYLPRLLKNRYGRISMLAAGPHEFDGLADSFAGLLEALASGK